MRAGVRLHVLNDLHIEIGGYEVAPVEADTTRTASL